MRALLLAKQPGSEVVVGSDVVVERTNGSSTLALLPPLHLVSTVKYHQCREAPFQPAHHSDPPVPLLHLISSLRTNERDSLEILLLQLVLHTAASNNDNRGYSNEINVFGRLERARCTRRMVQMVAQQGEFASSCFVWTGEDGASLRLGHMTGQFASSLLEQSGSKAEPTGPRL